MTNRLAPTNERLCTYLQQLTNDRSLLVQGYDYWSHMTVKGYVVYSGIYEMIRSSAGAIDSEILSLIMIPARKLINSCIVFCLVRSLGCYSPEPAHLLEIWNRFRRGTKSPLPKCFLLAAVYMLHIETFNGRFSTERPIIDNDRLKRLRSFAVWTPCPSGKGCQLIWNFSSKNWGLFQRGEQSIRSDCLLYRRYFEKEKHAAEPAGSKYESFRIEDERRKSDEALEECYWKWYASGARSRIRLKSVPVTHG